MNTALDSLSLAATIILSHFGSCEWYFQYNSSRSFLICCSNSKSASDMLYVKFAIVFKMILTLIVSLVMLSFYINTKSIHNINKYHTTKEILTDKGVEEIFLVQIPGLPKLYCLLKGSNYLGNYEEALPNSIVESFQTLKQVNYIQGIWCFAQSLHVHSGLWKLQEYILSVFDLRTSKFLSPNEVIFSTENLWLFNFLCKQWRIADLGWPSGKKVLCHCMTCILLTIFSSQRYTSGSCPAKINNVYQYQIVTKTFAWGGKNISVFC